MIGYDSFLKSAAAYKHHALLLCSRSFKEGLNEQNFHAFLNSFGAISTPQENLWDNIKNHPDVFVVDRTRAQLRKEDLEFAKEFLQYTPSLGKRKIVLIDRCERMNVQSANALLKVLEEPLSSTALFVLTTSSLKSVLPTIQSRCQKVYLSFPNLETPKRHSLDDEDFFWLEKTLSPLANREAKLVDKITSLKFLKFDGNQLSLKEAIESSEKISKKYSAQELFDAILLIIAQASKLQKSLSPGLKEALQSLRDWQEMQPYHVSSQLWLLRLVILAHTKN